MEFRSTLIRNVEIPSTLPSMDTLTNLKGSLILKEVSHSNDHLQIEGDLLWRGYFAESGDECLWEGAEYFSEELTDNKLRGENTPPIEPEILSLRGESISDDRYQLTFDILWFETEDPVEEEIVLPAPKEETQETTSHHCACHCEEPKTDLEEKLERIDETWRETIKAINDTPEKTAASPKEEVRPAETEPDDEVEIKCCPYSKFCLRYYRTQDGDELERIAEKFSATVAKLKEFNKLDSATISAGRMLRIP